LYLDTCGGSNLDIPPHIHAPSIKFDFVVDTPLCACVCVRVCAIALSCLCSHGRIDRVMLVHLNRRRTLFFFAIV